MRMTGLPNSRWRAVPAECGGSFPVRQKRAGTVYVTACFLFRFRQSVAAASFMPEDELAAAVSHGTSGSGSQESFRL